MKFDQYEKSGDYHWKWYETVPEYKMHVDRIVCWIAEKNILDAGCGDGLILSKLTEAGKSVIGIDNDPEGIRLAKSHKCKVFLESVYEINFNSHSFDSILLSDVIEHLDSPVSAINQAHRVVSGFLYITTPDYNVTKNKNPYHVREYNEDELINLVENVGFKLVESFIERNTIYAKFRAI